MKVFKVAVCIFISAFSVRWSEASVASITEPNVKWMKSNVIVCFGNKEHWKISRVWENSLTYKKIPKEDEGIEFTKDQKDLIQRAITTNYNSDETGIFYSGWLDCAQNPKADVYILRTHKPDYAPHGVASIGQQSAFVCQDRNGTQVCSRQRDSSITGKDFVLIDTYKTMPKLDLDNRMKGTALHEFGHLSGLRHEHARYEFAKNDFNCIESDLLNPNSHSREPEGATALLYSRYDANSIMNYCFNEMIGMKVGLKFFVKYNEYMPLELHDKSLYETKITPMGVQYSLKVALSTLDKHALKCMYIYQGQEFWKKCHENY